MRPGISVSAIFISFAAPVGEAQVPLTRKSDCGLIAAFIRLLRSSIQVEARAALFRQRAKLSVRPQARPPCRCAPS